MSAATSHHAALATWTSLLFRLPDYSIWFGCMRAVIIQDKILLHAVSIVGDSAAIYAHLAFLLLKLMSRQ